MSRIVLLVVNCNVTYKLNPHVIRSSENHDVSEAYMLEM